MTPEPKHSQTVHAPEWIGVTVVGAGCAVTVIGCAVLVGWAFDICILKSLHPAWVTMKANTALCFVLASMSLLLQCREPISLARRRAAQACAGLVALMGLLTLAEYVLGCDLSIDQLLFVEGADAVATSHPGRMAPNTALSFLALGVSLLLFDLRTRAGHFPFQHLALVPLLIAFAALCGYAYGSAGLYGFGSYTRMALHTAFAFGLLGLAVVFARPEAGIGRALLCSCPGGMVARRLVLPVILVPFLLGWLRIEGERAGLYDTGAGVALTVVATVAILLLLIGVVTLLMHRMEAERSEAEGAVARLAAIVESSDDAIVSKSLDGMILSWNAAAERMYGYAAAEVVGKSVTVLEPPDRAGEIAGLLARLRAGEHILHFETVRRRKNGDMVDVSLTLSPVYDPDRRIIGSSAIARDITEQKRAAAALKQAQEELDRFFSVSLDMLCISNADGVFKRVNPAFAQTLGWSAEELLARPFVEFVHPDDRAATLREVERQVVAGENVLHFENRYQHKDGSWRVLSWKSVPQPGGFMYAAARDVTELKQAEERLRSLNADLAHRSAQLAAANKELEAFSYSVSHDLRAPLRHIDGFTDLLRKNAGSKLDEKGQRYMRTISESAKQMGQLIDDLLVFSRMGRAEMRCESVNLSQIVASVQESLRQETVGRAITWKAGNLPEVQADPAMLRQAMVNLLGNAVKYTRPRAEAVIEIFAEEQPQEYVICVRDNGVGFDMQYAAKLFGVFQRLHSASEFEGTGIGLANVRRIIARHGGRTWAQGEVDNGASFFFALPRQGAEPRPSGSGPAAAC